MSSALKRMFRLSLVLFGLAATLAPAAEPPAPPARNENPIASPVTQDGLQQLQVRLDNLKQKISVVTDYTELVNLQNSVQVFVRDAESLSTSLVSEQARLQAQLGVLGPAAAAGAAPEDLAIKQQRAQLVTRNAQVDSELAMLKGLIASASALIAQTSRIRQSQLEAQVEERTGSILGARFWSPLHAPLEDDRHRLRAFVDQAAMATQAVWQPDKRTLSAALLLLALLVWLLGRPLLERGLAWVCIHQLPEGRLRRSSLALATTLATLITTFGALQLVYFALTREQPLPPALKTFFDDFVQIAFSGALITGTARALLSTKHPSWRLPFIPDPLARAMRPYPTILATLLVLFATQVQVGNAAGISSPAIIMGRGLTSLFVVIAVGALLLRIHPTRRALRAAGEAPKTRTPLAGLIYIAACLATLAALIALLSGYIILARVITYEMVWIYIVISITYLLIKFFQDFWGYLFSPSHAAGQALANLLNLGEAQLEQLEVILAGSSKTILLVLAVIALFVGGVGTTLGQLADSSVSILGGGWLHRLNIIPEHLLHAALTLCIGVYLTRSLGHWLDRELLPKTDMAPGMRASLSTLFSNVCYVLVVLLSFSALGVKWDNLAWIVSALSVGIGFGLQEIVKNFISGLILLTERPVKVGDLVSINGIEGDIRRINVRATEIQLSDRSIAIVPNSQLISQSLRNITLGGNALGVAILELQFPLDVDPEEVRDLLLSVCREHEVILEKPAPSVSFSQITPDGVTLKLKGYVSNPRIVGTAQSDLLFEILKQLKAAGISLAKPAN